MSTEKYKKKPYVFQEFPKMVYCPKTGHYTIAETAEEIPEGFLENPADCDEQPSEPTPVPVASPPAAPKAAPKTASKAAPKTASKAAPKTASKAAPKTASKEAITLASLGVKRAEAIEILEEEGVEFSVEATDDEIAELVSELLE